MTISLDDQSARILAVLVDGPMSSTNIAQTLGLNRVTLRRWLSLMQDSGDIERTGSTTKLKWRLCDGRTMPDDSECQPFNHVWRGIGEWTHKHPARAVVSVFDLARPK